MRMVTALVSLLLLCAAPGGGDSRLASLEFSMLIECDFRDDVSETEVEYKIRIGESEPFVIKSSVGGRAVIGRRAQIGDPVTIDCLAPHWCPTNRGRVKEDFAVNLPVFLGEELEIRVSDPTRRLEEIEFGTWAYRAQQNAQHSIELVSLEPDWESGQAIGVANVPKRLSRDHQIRTDCCASVYRFGVTGKVLDVKLVPGSSIVGKVYDSNREPLPGATVEIIPDTSGDSRGAKRILNVYHTVETKEQGFFQLKGLARGSYRLGISSPEHAHHLTEFIDIGDSEEVALTKGIVLERVATYAVSVTPPVDPLNQDPWRVTVVSSASRDAHSSITEGGLSEFQLNPGEHLVAIEPLESSDDEPSRRITYWRDVVDVFDGLVSGVDLDLAVYELAVTYNDEPLASDVAISVGDQDRVILSTGADGLAKGLARKPINNILLLTIHGKEPDFQRTLNIPTTAEGDTIRLAVDLEGVTVSGVVTTANDEPTPLATVTANYGPAMQYSSTTTTPDGAYVLPAVPADSVISARHPRYGQSVETPVPGTTDPTIDLRLLEPERIKGQVFGPDGQPLPGVRAQIIPALPTLSDSGSASTELDGTFEVKTFLSSHAVARVLSPSYGTWVGCVSIDPESVLEIRLQHRFDTRLELTFDSQVKPDRTPTLDPLILLSPSGGFLTQQTLFEMSKAEASTDRFRVTNIPPGTYWIGFVGRTIGQLADAACSGRIPAGMSRIEILPGQPQTFDLDHLLD